jgi:hypothetical protein
VVEGQDSGTGKTAVAAAVELPVGSTGSMLRSSGSHRRPHRGQLRNIARTVRYSQPGFRHQRHPTFLMQPVQD